MLIDQDVSRSGVFIAVYIWAISYVAQSSHLIDDFPETGGLHSEVTYN